MLFISNISKFGLGGKTSILQLSKKDKTLLSLRADIRKSRTRFVPIQASGSENEEEKNSLNKREETESSVFSFIKEVAEETRMVEWPSLERLFKQFVIVVISLVLSAFVIYSVDGFFASLSQFLFEGKS